MSVYRHQTQKRPGAGDSGSGGGVKAKGLGNTSYNPPSLADSGSNVDLGNVDPGSDQSEYPDSINNSIPGDTSIPNAKPGQFVDQRSWFDMMRGVPNTAQQYNNQILLNQIQGQQGVQNSIAQAKGLQPIQQAGQQYTDLLQRQSQQHETLNKQLSNMSADQDAAENIARYNPDISNNLPTNQVTGQPRSPLMSGSFDPHNPMQYNGGDPDPAAMFQARQQIAMGPIAKNAADISQNLLARDQAGAQIPGAYNETTAQQQSRINAAKLNAATSGLNLDVLNQNRPLTMDTSGIQAQGGLEGARGQLQVARDLPLAKLQQEQAQTGLLKSQGNYLDAVKTGLGQAQTAEALQHAKSPAQNDIEMMNAFGIKLPGSVNSNIAAQPTTTITAPPMSIKPAPINSPIKIGVNATLNPDGSIVTKIPIMGADGKIIPAGTLMQKKTVK